MPTFTIGPFIYPTKAEATAAVRAILHSAPLATPLEGPEDVLVRSLVEMHPNAAEKIGVGIEAITVAIIEHGHRGFWLHRCDGTSTDFSYRKALTRPSRRNEVRAAMRRAVMDQILDYRDQLFDSNDVVVCPITGNPLTVRDGHVDHITPFAAIADAFLEGYGLQYDDVSLSAGVDGQIGRELVEPLRSQWASFHDYVATYRFIHPAANRRRGAA